MRKNYVFTFITYGISFLSSLFIYYYISHYFPKIEFEKYNLSKRVLSISQVLLMLGIIVALPRAVAYEIESKYGQQKIPQVFNAALIITVLTTLIFACVILIHPVFWSQFFWGTPLYPKLIAVVGVYGVSFAVFNIPFAFSRGLMLFSDANIFTTATSLCSILVLLFTNNVIGFFLANTVINVVLGVTMSLLVFTKMRFKIDLNFNAIINEAKSLLAFGVPRIPGDLALDGIMSVPVFLTAHYINTSNASSLGFAVALTSMAGAFLSPISLILLPYTSKLFSESKMPELRMHVKKIFLIFIPIMFIGTLMAFFLSSTLLKILVGEVNPITLFYIKVVSLAFIPYVSYLIVRSVLDAVFTKPVNAINSIISFGLMFATSYVLYSLKLSNEPALYGLIAGLFSLGILSYLSYLRFIKQH